MSYKFKIGIVGWSTGENSFGATKPYLYQLSKYGTLTILAAHEEPDTTLDIVFMPGGKDISAWSVGERPSFRNTDADQFKEYFMHNTLVNYINAGIPIWGTCLGAQQLMVHFGSVLSQDLPNHETTDSDKRWEAAHPLIVEAEYKPLEDAALSILRKNNDYKKKRLEGNSLHHQGVKVDDLSADLKLIAYSPDDIVEVFEHPTIPIAGNQGHMEEDWNVLALRLFRSTMEKSPRYQEYLINNNEEVHN